ncbi:holo-ACP synthase [Halobacteriales archaeon QS_1_68_20]|nr:MAG: holo-ACP synthase [Halobacteriales archaeon QS_1_68_20]
MVSEPIEDGQSARSQGARRTGDGHAYRPDDRERTAGVRERIARDVGGDADPRVRTGVDVQSVATFRGFDESVAAGIKERAFTEAERAYCEGTRDPAQHYAARWAAKEAFYKLLSTDDAVPFASIEVARGDPRPRFDLGATAREALAESFGGTVPELDVSLSHDGEADVAVAQVVAVDGGERA